MTFAADCMYALAWRNPPARAMRALGVLDESPPFQADLGHVQCRVRLHVQEFFPDGRHKTLRGSVLPRAARGDEDQGDVVGGCPTANRLGDVLSPVVASDCLGIAFPFHRIDLVRRKPSLRSPHACGRPPQSEFPWSPGRSQRFVRPTTSTLSSPLSF